MRDEGVCVKSRVCRIERKWVWEGSGMGYGGGFRGWGEDYEMSGSV